MSSELQSQTLDTLVDVGGYKLHFTIIKGKGTPILFEAGGGEDATTWNSIIKPIAAITKTTLITYDRAGFGKSTFDTTRHGIRMGIIGLERGLHKLGYTGNLILVAHSQGGLYATLFASRHPGQVKAAVLIDITTSCFYQGERLITTQRSIDGNNSGLKFHPGSYYQGADFSNNINYVRNFIFPKNIPVTDFVSDFTPFSDSIEAVDWKNCHRDFVSMSVNRTGITAYGCGHFIFEDNPPLIINAIAKAFAGTVDNIQYTEVLKRSMDYSITAANESRKEEIAYRHSENDLNRWGNKLVEQGAFQKALEVFKLNTLLHPLSWKVFDSYGKALHANGQKEEAIKAYRRSIELNPNNEIGKKALGQIDKE